MPNAGIESRRANAFLLKVPLAVSCDGEEPVRAHTLVVNGHGALILVPRLSPCRCPVARHQPGDGQAALCRVACCCGEDLPGLFKSASRSWA
jgi:hypothetical protein